MEDPENPQSPEILHSPSPEEAGSEKVEESSQSSESEVRAIVPVPPQPEADPPPPASESEGDQEREYGCRYCHKIFSNKQALGGHQNAHKMERAVEKSAKEAQESQFNYYGAAAAAAPGLGYPAMAAPTAVAVAGGHLFSSFNVMRPYDHLNRASSAAAYGHHRAYHPGQQIHYGGYNIRVPPPEAYNPHRLVPGPYPNLHPGSLPYPYHPGMANNSNNSGILNQGLDGRFLTLGIPTGIGRGQAGPGYGLRLSEEASSIAANRMDDHQETDDPTGLDLSLKL